ncbi:MAG: (d)CMP kinase, partial [Bacteriovoracaceae bacterium]|nr:(d)CMP kinase [Bacteriovoracaceae bacterium]
NEVRAKRRLKQLREQGDNEIQLDQIIEDIKTRDERDSGRAVAPLKQADDATKLDTSNLSFDQVLDCICDLAHSRGKELGIKV